MDNMSLDNPRILCHIRHIVNCDPITLNLHVTNKCNMRCTHCIYYMHSKTNGFDPENELNYSDICKIISKFGMADGKSVQFSGGEPTLHPCIIDILRYTEYSGLKWGMISNGTNCDGIAYHPTWLRFSLDAGTGEVWSSIHNTEVSFDTTISGISNCITRFPDTTIGGSFITTRYNYKDIVNFTRLCYNLGMSYCRITFGLMEDGQAHFDDIMDEIQELGKESQSYSNDKFKVNMLLDRVGFMSSTHDYDECYMSKSRIFIGADGYLYPCCELSYIKKYRVRNILEDMNFKVGVNPRICPPCDYDGFNIECNDICSTVRSIEHKEFV